MWDFLTKIAIYLSWTSKLQEKSSDLKREHPALQKHKNFLNFFLCIISALLEPGSESGSGSTDLIGSGYIPDPSPKHGL